MRAIKYVDVFTDEQFMGNPVAVVLDADGLSDDDMQRIAAWTNLSETTFYLPATQDGADYRLRIFTPRGELPFAGHPTIGSAHALLQAGIVTPTDNVMVQECGAGLIPISVAASGTVSDLQLEMPVAKFADLNNDQQHELAGILGTTLQIGTVPSIVDVGPRWIIAKLANAQAVLDVTPDYAAMAAFERATGAVGVTIYGDHSSGATGIEVRSFAPSSGIEEDPVCGSGNGAVGFFRLRHSEISNGDAYVAGQGQCVGRNGRVSIAAQGGKVFVGGKAITSVDGVIS